MKEEWLDAESLNTARNQGSDSWQQNNCNARFSVNSAGAELQTSNQ